MRWTTQVIEVCLPDELQNVRILRQIRVTILSPEMSTLMNYEVIERWILAEKYIFRENFLQISDSMTGAHRLLLGEAVLLP